MTATNWQYLIAGSRSFIFSRRPTQQECKWLLEAYAASDDDRYTLMACPDSYASDDAVLSLIRANISQSSKAIQ